MRTHRSGFPVSGSQGMGNREAAPNSLISINLTLPRQVASARMPGKPICHLPARDSGDARQDRSGDAPLKFVKAIDELGFGRIEQIQTRDGRPCGPFKLFVKRLRKDLLSMTLYWTMLSIADGRATHLLAGTGGADIAVAI